VQGKAAKRKPTSLLESPFPTPNIQASNSSHSGKFIPVRDSRNRRVPGLYQRNGRFYAQLWVDRGFGKKSARRFALFNSDNLPARTCKASAAADYPRHNDMRLA
jgi:hypothetical protein